MSNYAGVTATTRQLLQYWSNRDRDRPLYFCQFEALETAIWLAEVADRQDGGPILRELRQANDGNNPLLYRIAFKMATGAGKTAVMGMIIAWQCLNRLANFHDGRFTDAFLIVTSGITIKDRQASEGAQGLKQQHCTSGLAASLPATTEPEDPAPHTMKS
jgi:type III restriction enzyme